MLNKIKFIILSITFLPLFIKAQATHTIQGIVFDNETGLPMYGIYVECDNSARSLITEPSGKFRFDSLENAKHQLKFIDPRGGYIRIDSTLFPIDTVQNINMMVTITMKISCLYYKQMANKAIENKEIYFLTKMRSTVLSKNDMYLEKTYKVDYRPASEGCMGIPKDCIKEHNKIISAYLTKTYGNRWKKKVRKDILF